MASDLSILIILKWGVFMAVACFLRSRLQDFTG